MASARLVGVVSTAANTACGKRFANRWAYKHCQPTLLKPMFSGDRLLFSAAQAILNDCNQKINRLHRCSPLYCSPLYNLTRLQDHCDQAEEIVCKIWTYLHLYSLMHRFCIFGIYLQNQGVRGGARYANLCICSIFCVVNIWYFCIYSLYICIYLHIYFIYTAYFSICCI